MISLVIASAADDVGTMINSGKALRALMMFFLMSDLPVSISMAILSSPLAATRSMLLCSSFTS